MELTASNLIKIPPEERDSYYRYPYTGPYEDEPDLYEILHLQEHHNIWGPNPLTIHHVCPACGSLKAKWIRVQWSVCFHCLLAFDAFEWYIDLTEDEEMESKEECMEPEYE